MPEIVAEETLSAADAAYDYVKARILRTDLQEGEFITEGDVASALGVSRTPVREAFHRLEVEHLLRLVPRKGAFVPPITRREVVEVMEARRLIERWAVEHVVNEGLPVQPDLERLLEEQQRHLAAGDHDDFIDSDRRFHRVIVEAPGNNVMLRVYDELRDRQMRMGVRAVASDPARARRVLDEHRRVAAAIDAGDATDATEAAEGHLAATLGALDEVR